MEKRRERKATEEKERKYRVNEERKERENQEEEEKEKVAGKFGNKTGKERKKKNFLYKY